MKRIDWTTYENAQVYAATMDLLAKRKVALPVSDPQSGKLFMQAIRDAQVVITENRRRALTSIDAVSGELRKRFQDNGVLPQHIDCLRRGYKKRADREQQVEDPKDVRIRELEAQVKVLEEENQALEDEQDDFTDRIKELEARPDAMQVVQQWCSKMLADALRDALPSMPKVADLSAQVAPKKEPLPQFERDRRRDPEAAASGGSPKAKKRIAIIGGYDEHHRVIHTEVGAFLDLRYVRGDAAVEKIAALKDFSKEPGTSTIVWTTELGSVQLRAAQLSIQNRATFNGNVDGVVHKLRTYIEKERS
jgi:hypothetical protein